MKNHASLTDNFRGGQAVDLTGNRTGLRPTCPWCFEPVEQSGLGAATNPKLRPRKRARIADCYFYSGALRVRFGKEDDHGGNLQPLCRTGCP
jgi:hypothetical protein